MISTHYVRRVRERELVMSCSAEEMKEMRQTISDLSKAAFGFRVRKDYAAMSDEQLVAEYDYFLKAAQETFAREEEEEKEAVKRWESELASIMEAGASSRSQAIKWHAASVGEVEDFQHDPGYYCFECGIPYSFEKEVKAALAA
jgi:hypothetical protein